MSIQFNMQKQFHFNQVSLALLRSLNVKTIQFSISTVSMSKQFYFKEYSLCLFVWAYGISAFVGYLMTNPFLYQ